MDKRLILLVLFVCLLESIKAQKGEISVSAGPLLSFPLYSENRFYKLTTGPGIEAIGQYNFSNKSSLLLQAGWTSYGTSPKVTVDSAKKRQTIYSIRVGYRYQFGSSGFYTNILGGFEKYSVNDFSSSSFAVGIGKRFFVKEIYFIDAAADCITGSIDVRVNVKILFGFIRRPK